MFQPPSLCLCSLQNFPSFSSTHSPSSTSPTFAPAPAHITPLYLCLPFPGTSCTQKLTGSFYSCLVSLGKFSRFHVLCQNPVFFLRLLYANFVCVSVHPCMGSVACFNACMVWCEQWCTNAHLVPLGLYAGVELRVIQ